MLGNHLSMKSPMQSPAHAGSSEHSPVNGTIDIDGHAHAVGNTRGAPIEHGAPEPASVDHPEGQGGRRQALIQAVSAAILAGMPQSGVRGI